jgi:predicted MFS family arabinose efflux permease
MFQALRIRDFRLLWGGGAISYLGSWLLVLAVPAHIFLATRSLAATGLTLAAQYLPLLLLGPVAGVLTDRWNRRWILITTNLSSAVVVAAMLLGLGPGRYWIFYVALVAESCGTALAVPALRARVPAIVGTGPLLNSANSLNSFSNGAIRLIGGPIGGILFAALGIEVLIIADALSYLVAAGAIMMTAGEARQRPRRSSVQDIITDLRNGLGILLRERSARGLLPVSVIFLAANASLSAVVVAFGIRQLGGSRPTGFLFAALGVGFLVGAPILKITLDRFPAKYLLFVTLAATAASYLFLFHSTSLYTALPAAVANGMFGSMSLVIPQTIVQRVIPNEALGRISAVFLTGEAAATLAGALAGPLLAQSIQLHGLATVASLTTAVGAVLTVILVPARVHEAPA